MIWKKIFVFVFLCFYFALCLVAWSDVAVVIHDGLMATHETISRMAFPQ
jgi:hypothetical protein